MTKTGQSTTSDTATDQDPQAPTDTAEGTATRLLHWIERLPKLAVFVGVLVITIGVLMTPGPAGAVLTFSLAVGSAYLIWATWRKQTATATRLARIAVVIALVALGISKLFV